MTDLSRHAPCGPLCQHPSCWGTLGRRRHDHVTQHGGQYDSDSGSDTELPTLKVYDMMSDYGPRRPSHTAPQARKTSSEAKMNHRVRRMYERISSGLDAPHTTPASTRSPTTAKSSRRRGPSTSAVTQSAGTSRRKESVSRVIVHELVNVKDMRNRPAEDKIGVKMVWVPRKKRKQRHITKPTIHQMTSRAPAVVPVNDVTEQFLPPSIDADKNFESKRRQQPVPGVSPRRFYAGNKSELTVDLLSLPPDILQAVIHKLQENTELDEPRILEALMRVVPTFSLHEDATTAAYKTLLTQERATIHEPAAFSPRIPPALQPAYVLDQEQDGAPADDDDEEERAGSEDGDHAPSLSQYPDTQPPVLNKKTPLPPIKSTSVTNISLGLPEIPSGIKYTKTFTYRKKHFQDFTLGPVSPVPHDDRSSPRTLGESSVHMACPTESSVLGESADTHRLREVEFSLPLREQIRRQRTPRRDLVTNTRTSRYKMDPVPQPQPQPQAQPGPGPPPASPVSFGLEPILESMENTSSPVHMLPESTVALSEPPTPRSRTRQSSRPGTGGAQSPDTWPNIREEDYLQTPEPPENTLVQTPEPEPEPASHVTANHVLASHVVDGHVVEGHMIDLQAPPPSPFGKSPSPDYKDRGLYTLEEEGHDSAEPRDHLRPVAENGEQFQLATEITEARSEPLPAMREDEEEEEKNGNEEEENENGNNNLDTETWGEMLPPGGASLEDQAANMMSDIMAQMGLGQGQGQGQGEEDTTGVWGMWLG